jgi:hypothetical protein
MGQETPREPSEEDKSLNEHHSGAQGRDFAGRKRTGGSGAVATGGGWCSESCQWLRTGLSCPWGAVNCRIMLARLIGWQCATAGGPWRCACGPVGRRVRFMG